MEINLLVPAILVASLVVGGFIILRIRKTLAILESTSVQNIDTDSNYLDKDSFKYMIGEHLQKNVANKDINEITDILSEKLYPEYSRFLSKSRFIENNNDFRQLIMKTSFTNKMLSHINKHNDNNSQIEEVELFFKLYHNFLNSLKDLEKRKNLANDSFLHRKGDFLFSYFLSNREIVSVKIDSGKIEELAY
jgi:hypothetical protein